MGRTARTDAELLAASRRGETAAFGSLVERYQNLVCAVSYAATGDRVLSEDVAQETFLAAWTRLDDLRETGKLRGWLCAIARNLGLKALRRLGREVPTAATPVDASAAPSPLEQTLQAESTRVVWESLSRVPEIYREALVLYYQEGQSADRVAATLGISENAALQRLSRGRRHLADSVASVVESSLSRRRPPAGFAAGIVAALPAVRPVSSSTPPAKATQGGTSSMFKIAIAISALAAVGGTAYVVGQRSAAPVVEEAPPASPLAVQAAPTPDSAAAPALPTFRRRAATTPPPAPNAWRREGDQVIAPEPDEKARVDGAQLAALQEGPSRGPADAPVTIVMFSDFMCPFCERVVATVDSLLDEYPGKVRLVMKQFPVHDEARLAAEAALAAEAQGKFWELHDMMMTNQRDLSRDALVQYATQVGIDAEAFARALDEHTYGDAVAEEIQAGQEIDVRGTPAFLINGRLVVGARPIEDFRSAIEGELERKGLAPR